MFFIPTKEYRKGCEDEYMTGAPSSDALKNLMLFIIGLAILGTLLALAWYFAIDMPARQAMLYVPLNADPTLVDGQIT
jgi:hypothetical protein